jgi:hypothetical protein
MGMVKKANHAANLGKIFRTLDAKTLALSARESSAVEFKENFNWGSKDKYAKTMAAFANNQGGYIIFGIANSPRRLIGLQSQNFELFDEATITAYLNGAFSPEIHYEKFAFSVDNAGKQIGVIYTHQCEQRPVIPIKNDGDIREAEVYYRYNARNDKIKYPELKRLFELAQERERKHWVELFERVSRIGPSNAGIMDIANGTIEGSGNNLLIDAALLPKLRFIKEGTLSEAGKPVLKLIGDVQPIASMAPFQGEGSPIRLTSDPQAPTVREESILDQYPLGYAALIKKLRRRYTDFKQSVEFHRLKRELSKNPALCKTRLLDPNKPRGTSKDFYNLKIVDEFDKHYTKRS